MRRAFLERWVPALGLLALVCSCGGSGGSGGDATGPGQTTVAGRAQKGPLLAGGSVEVWELGPELTPVGAPAVGVILDDLGRYSVSARFASPLVEIRVSGTCFDEVSPGVTSAPLRLTALADLSEPKPVNVNSLTTISAARIRSLVRGGLPFAEAKARAEAEVLAVLPLHSPAAAPFEALDLTGSTEADGTLLAASLVLFQAAHLDGLLVDLPESWERLVGGLQDLLDSRPTPAAAAVPELLSRANGALDVAAARDGLAGLFRDLGAPGAPAPFEAHINRPPSARAGPDRVALCGESASLDPRESRDPDRDPLTFAWALVSAPAGPAATLTVDGSGCATFAAEVAGDYVLRLTVEDGRGAASTDEVGIRVAEPTPVADAGPDAGARVGRSATLDGSGSRDPDGDPLSYAWSLISAPAGSASMLSDPQAERPTFLPDLAGSYVFRLTVSDGRQESAPDDVALQVTDNLPPVAGGGAPRTLVGIGAEVWSLDPRGSYDPDGDRLTYSWSLIQRPEGSDAVIARPDSYAPSLVPDIEGVYVAELKVSDGLLWSEPSTVQLRAERFTVGEPLPDLAGGHGTLAIAINSRGQVAGKATVALQNPSRTEVHAVVWTDGAPRDLGTFGGTGSVAFDLNEGGDAVGVADEPDGTYDGFLWSEGRLSRLASLGGGWSHPTAINDRRQIVGYSATGPFLWEAGVMAPLPKPAKGFAPGEYRACTPLDIDEAGTAVGYCWDQDGTQLRMAAVRWDAQGCTVLTPGFAEAKATEIDGQGRIWGYLVREATVLLFRFEGGSLAIEEALGPLPLPHGEPGQRGLVAAGQELVAVSDGVFWHSVSLRSGNTQGSLTFLLEPRTDISSINDISAPGGPMVGVYDYDLALPWVVTTTSYVITP